MKSKIVLLYFCCYTFSITAQSLNPLAASLFNNVKSKLTTDQKNAIAQSSGLTITSDKSLEADGMPVNGAWTFPTDINKDGSEDIFLIISSTALYGNSGQGFFIFMKDAKGNYNSILNETGVPGILKNVFSGYPEILIGGPGFGKMPVLRWNGKAYVFNREVNAEITPSLGVEDMSAAYIKTLTD